MVSHMEKKYKEKDVESMKLVKCQIFEIMNIHVCMYKGLLVDFSFIVKGILVNSYSCQYTLKKYKGCDTVNVGSKMCL